MTTKEENKSDSGKSLLTFAETPLSWFVRFSGKCIDSLNDQICLTMEQVSSKNGNSSPKEVNEKEARSVSRLCISIGLSRLAFRCFSELATK